jgi:phenylpropionate dioxygenase-like ring-hydroxylating dioxygenase large terminal subunit
VQRDAELSLLDRLVAVAEGKGPRLEADESRIPVDHYLSPARFDAERAGLFRALPIIVAHASQIAGPGDFVSHDALGVPLVVTRDASGGLRAFINVCRHRGARLATAESGHAKAFVCGYHGWSYGLDGALLHIPHAEGFPRACGRDLVPVPVEERAGFVWVVPRAEQRGATIDVRASLGPFAAELEGFDLAGHVAQRTEHVRRRFHWKLIIDAFLDGYHIKRLHRDSVYRFFLDNVNVTDAFGAHQRSTVARQGLAGLRTTPREAWRFRDAVSLTYFLFPNTVLVFHPDWVSRITVFPLAIDETLFTHTMLVPADAATSREAHWERTWRLIHETVFEREDMVAAEWIQSGLDSGANESFACGTFEAPIRAFHDAIERTLAAESAASGA